MSAVASVLKSLRLRSAGQLWSQSSWDAGLRKLVHRRWFFTGGSALLACLLAGWTLATAVTPQWNQWLAPSIAASVIGCLFILLLNFYEQARAEELLGLWLEELQRSSGGRIKAAAVLVWVQRLEQLTSPPYALLTWLALPRFRMGRDGLLELAAKLAKQAIVADPLSAAGHLQLATALACQHSYCEREEDEEYSRRCCLDELAIAQGLAPLDIDTWHTTVECACRLRESEVELHARERMMRLCTEPEMIEAYGAALLRHGFPGQAFALYREWAQDDPEVARKILDNYLESNLVGPS